MKRVVVIILNYMNYQDTKECIDSILKQEYDNYHILVVDNGSKNESFLYLKRLYKKNPYVSVIKTGKNYGFAKGNNIGIFYARKNLKAEYIMLLNNDTILIDPLYIKRMLERDEVKVGVIGSRILQSDGTSMKKICRYVDFPETCICYLKTFFESIGLSGLQKIFEYKFSECKGKYILHGCVLLLTPAYFRIYSDLDHRTFLYCEEELLYLRCEKAGLKETLVDETFLYHKGGCSSGILYDNNVGVYNKYFLSSYKFVVLESIKNFIVNIFICNRYNGNGT